MAACFMLGVNGSVQGNDSYSAANGLPSIQHSLQKQLHSTWHKQAKMVLLTTHNTPMGYKNRYNETEHDLCLIKLDISN